MGRKDDSILNLLTECPWWVSVVVSTFAFVLLRFIFPSIIFPGMAANAFSKGLSSAAPFVALVLLLPAPIAALNSTGVRQSFKFAVEEMDTFNGCGRDNSARTRYAQA